jgi:glycine/D-amino acid oxidase-like deaminating enzyme
VLPPRAGILVIGGGITGVSMLHWLRDSDTVLVERDRLAAGASGRNAGFISQGIGESYAAGVRRHGRARAAASWAFTIETHDLLEAELAGRSRHHRRRGLVKEAADADESRDLEESGQLLQEDGFDARWDGSRLLFSRDGEHNPVETVLSLASGAPDDAIREGVDVSALDASPSGVRVEAGGRECVAEVVVLATNAYTPLLLPDVPIEPVRGQIAATGPVTDRIAACPTSRERGFQYWNQRWDGRVLAGGYRNWALAEEVGYDARPTSPIQSHLDRHLEQLGVRARVTHRWAGIMGFTGDGFPIVGPVPGRPNVYVCAGYNGSGMSFAFHCARLLAERLRSGGGAPALPWG